MHSFCKHRLQERSSHGNHPSCSWRLQKRPFYHLTVTNSRNARDGRFVERIGFFNPVATGGEVRLSVDQERATYWLGQGAQPSERVAQLLKDAAKANA